MNDLLTAFSILKIFVLIRAGLILTPYRNTRCKFFYSKIQQIDYVKCMDVKQILVLV